MPDSPPIARLVASRWSWVLLSLVCIAALGYSLSDLFEYAGIDLRNRVVGARALLLSMDPYNVAWRPGMPLELADTHQRYPGVTRVTAPPPLLLLYVPFAELSYRTQQIIWWALQWIALAICISVLARSFTDGFPRGLFLCIAVLCFVGSWFWRLHVERGQYYIFSTMLICIDLAVLRSADRRPMWLGIPSGIAVAIKPTNVILLPMLWFLGERRASLVCASTAALMVLASLYPSGPQVWSSFLSTIRQASQYERNPGFESRRFGPVQAVAPEIIEGADFGKALPLGVDGDKIIPTTLTNWVGRAWTSYLNRIILVSLCIAGPFVVWWIRQHRTISRDAVLLWMTLVLAAIEFVRPWRWTYVDVTFLPIAAFLLTTMPRSLPFIILAVLTYALYLGPLESKWVVVARHFLTIALVLAVVAHRAIGGAPGPKSRQM